MTKDELVCLVNERLDALAKQLGIERRFYFIRYCGITLWLDRDIPQVNRLEIHDVMQRCEEAEMPKEVLREVLCSLPNYDRTRSNLWPTRA